MLVCLMFSLRSLRLSSFVFKNNLFNFGCAGFLLLCLLGGSFSLVVESGDCSLVAVQGLLSVVASLVAQHRLEGTWAQ